MHKKHQMGDNSKVIKRELPFLHATHRHDLFYITVKYHQNIPNGNQVTEQTRKCLRTDVRTDEQTMYGRLAHRYIPRTFRSGDKNGQDFSTTCEQTQPHEVVLGLNSYSCTQGV